MTLAWYTDLADEYGRWAVDVLDAFDVVAAPMIGTSYDPVIVRTGAYAPDRIQRAAVVVPGRFGVQRFVRNQPSILACRVARWVPRRANIQSIQPIMTGATLLHSSR